MGGISIKHSAKRIATIGVTTVTATMMAVASMRLKVNLVVMVPLTENMIWCLDLEGRRIY